MSKARAEIVVRGRVQGVFYRQSTREMAISLGLKGWVKNCPDGTVTAVFEGEMAHVRQAIDWCRQGPPAARVSDIDVCWQEYGDEFPGFTIQR